MNSNNETETNILDPDSINTADVDVEPDSSFENIEAEDLLPKGSLEQVDEEEVLEQPESSSLDESAIDTEIVIDEDLKHFGTSRGDAHSTYLRWIDH